MRSLQDYITTMKRNAYRLVVLGVAGLGIAGLGIAGLGIVAHRIWVDTSYPPRGKECPDEQAAPEISRCDGPLQNQMPRNQMPRNQMPRNGLSTESLLANAGLMSFLRAHPLGKLSELGEQEGAELIRNRHAPDLLTYIVSCALDPCQEITLAGQQWTGELGLCGSRMPGGGWLSAAPTPDCLERVSSCVLARANALNMRVVISMWGHGMESMDRVPVETHFRENRGTPIRSFQRCSELCIWGDKVRRNCDFSPRHVGQCVGGKVTLTASRPQTRIRVCAGIHGCDDPLGGGTTDDLKRSYGGEMIGQGSQRVTFSCPENGPLVERSINGETREHRSGYYSVMLAPAVHGGRLDETTDVIASDQSDGGAYPAPEAAVFTYREGAFFGDIFTTPEPTDDAACAGQTIAREQHACFSELWDEGNAYLSHRICAGPTSDYPEGCFESEPGLCISDGEGEGRCQSDAQGYFEGCSSAATAQAPARAWPGAYTIYLNHPCDLTDGDAACLGRLLRRDVARTLGQRAGHAGPGAP